MKGATALPCPHGAVSIAHQALEASLSYPKRQNYFNISVIVLLGFFSFDSQVSSR